MSDTNIEGDHCRQCEKLEHDLEMANLVNKRLRVSWHEDVNEARKERDEAEAEQNVIRAKYMDICETLSRELSEARAQLKAARSLLAKLAASPHRTQDEWQEIIEALA